MFQHPAKPNKRFLHTKIYLSNKSIVFLLLISRGSHILTVWQKSVSSSGSQGTYLILVSAAHFTGVMSHLITDDVRLTCHWATDWASVCTVSVFPLAQRWYLPVPPASPRTQWPADAAQTPGTGQERSPQCISWHRNIDTGECQHPGSGPWPCSLAPAQPPTLHCAAHLSSHTLRGKLKTVQWTRIKLLHLQYLRENNKIGSFLFQFKTFNFLLNKI